MEEFMDLGNEITDAKLDEVINSQKPNQCCVLIYTSGTTGKPKGVMLIHDNITWTATHAGQAGDLQPAETQQETIVSYLPLSHIVAQIYDLWTGIKWGEQVYFAEPDTLKVFIGLYSQVPFLILSNGALWEKIMEKIKEVSAQSEFVKKKMLSCAMSISLEGNLNCSRSDLKPFRTRLADYLVLAKIHHSLGFSHCWKHFCGAASLTTETLQFFLSLNILLYEAYGMSETTGPHCMLGPYVYRCHSCGKAVTGCKVKLVNEDADVFMGYLNMEDKTKEAIDEDGWLHSRDLGKLDKDGFLYITGRIKELIITAGGENVSPIPIEDAVKKELPVVSNAILIGDRKKSLSMITFFILKLGSREFCQKAGSKATKVSEIARMKDQAVYQAIQDGIDRVNMKAAANVQRIQKWTVLEKDFSISGGEFGPTMKLSQLAVVEKYKDEIDSFYKE
uniref:Long-chain-fatty-acid--CoA ligase ACSBG1 n=1 Tax=Sphenodon punctatus TaxID=8508 RepID=A0A8D0HEB3_SPHPU